MSKQYDVVLFGATGFTGKLVASYLDTHSGKPRWAMAGRSKARLEGLVSSLGLKSSPGVIEADTAHPETLKAMARQAKSVINVVGPFRKLRGDLVVEACVAEKAHYVDLSGETNFNATIIERFHEAARKAGVVVGCSVGLDSLPSDLSTYLAVKHLRQAQGCPGAEVAYMCLGEVGTFSSGTLHSAIDMAEEDATQLQFVKPGALATRDPPHAMNFSSAVYMPQFEAYGSSYVLTPHNVRTVFRSWSLLQDAGGDDAYGAQFDYEDLLLTHSWLFSKAIGLVMQASTLFLTSVPPVRAILKRIAKPGGGPSEKIQHSTKTDVRTLAVYGQKRSLCTMKCQGDPGQYGSGDRASGGENSTTP